MPKILVTGGLGYIGSHTVVELHKQGFEVIIVDDLSNTSFDILERSIYMLATNTRLLSDTLSHKSWYMKQLNIYWSLC